MRETKISIFKSLYKTDVPYIVSLEKALDRIRLGKSKERVLGIRKAEKEGNKELKQELKKQLPAVIVSGEFSERNKKGLINHSGLMILDFDKYPDQKTLDNHFKELKKIKNFVSLFISPSGNGIKGIVKIPNCDAITHEKHFKAFNELHNFDYFDISNCNVDRVCFESYDPNIYINYEAETFEPQLIDKGYAVHEKVPLLPITDENKLINLISNFGWSKSFIDGQRNNFILDIAGMMCEYGVGQFAATNYLSQYISDGFTEGELTRTIKSAYKLRTANSKFFEDNDTITAIKNDLKKGQEYVIEKHNIDEEKFEEISEDFINDSFWEVDRNGKVSIVPMQYRLFLERAGFKKYFSGSHVSLVFIESNKVEETTTERIKDFVLNYLSDAGEVAVWNYCAKYTTLFSDQFLTMIDTIELLMLRDTRTSSFIAFRNGILEVTKDDHTLFDYIDVDGYVWKNQIIDRDFVDVDNSDNDYKTFINNISNSKPEAIECVIGYLLSNYKNKMNNKAIILNDEVISDNPEGGTGKGLFVQGIKQIRRTAILDGKSFDDKKSFPYQTVSQDTNILVFDDVKKNFNFESKFSLVTEGLTLERKNKDAIKLTVEQSPKLVISTNYAIKGEGNSHDRRRHEIEFTQYYGADIDPFIEFNRQMFADWELVDWIAFDNYMIECLKSYLNLGLIKQDAKNLLMRKFIAETSMEFSEWIEDVDNVRRDLMIGKKDAFNSFVEEYPDFKKYLSSKRYNIWIKKFCNFKGLKYSEGSTTGERWFKITTGNESEIVTKTKRDEMPF